MSLDEEFPLDTQVEVRPGEFKRLGDMTTTELLAAADLAQRRAEASRSITSTSPMSTTTLSYGRWLISGGEVFPPLVGSSSL